MLFPANAWAGNGEGAITIVGCGESAAARANVTSLVLSNQKNLNGQLFPH
ncbi:MAG: hypothetical protein HYV28_19400 [Ignavibacteriales bacterium]|nr:hypothetical protein [Ignavibacteriales bacterium]